MFFTDLARGKGDSTLSAVWGREEQAGVNFGMDLARSAIGQPTGFEATLVNQFVFDGDRYRDAVTGNASIPIILGPLNGSMPLADPRLDRRLIYVLAMDLEGENAMVSCIYGQIVNSPSGPISV